MALFAFSQFNTILACDRQTFRRTSRQTSTAYTALAWRRLVKMVANVINLLKAHYVPT